MTATRAELRFEFRRVDLKDFWRYDEIMAACFGRQPDENYFRWKYLENPAGPLVAFEALHDGRVAAFYGVIPWYFDVHGDRCLFYQSMDTMTHPDYQRRGLFVALANLTYEEVARCLPEHVLVGIPGPTSFPGFVGRLGWMNPVRFKYLFAPRAAFRALAIAHPKRRVDAEKIVSTDPLRAYFERRESSPVISPSLSTEFLEWRVLRHQVYQYRLLAIHERGDVIGIVVYRHDDPGRVFIELIDFASPALWSSHAYTVLRTVFEDTGARLLYTWEPTRAEVRSAYRRAGFIKNPVGHGPFSYEIPLIVRAPQTVFRGINLGRRESYDLQPLLQD